MAECFLRGDARRSGLKAFQRNGVICGGDIPIRDGLTDRAAVDRVAITIESARARELTQDCKNTASTMYIFHMVKRRARRHFAELWHIPRERVDIGHGEVEFSFLRRG